MYSLLVTLWNLWHFEDISIVTAAMQSNESLVFVSVLVPARNEELNIAACIESLCRQDYPAYEVIVLNDGSEDATGSILESLQQQYPSHLRLLQGSPLPKGWIGKPWACHQLSQQAKGDFLLFTDADTVHHPQMLTSAVAYQQHTQVDFFSVIPYEVMATWSEQLVLPLIHYLYVAYLPNQLFMRTNDVRFSAANGQFMFFRRSAYEHIGGHESVRNNVVEDVFLAKVVKSHGFRMSLAKATEVVRCRMYHNVGEVFAGFSKNFFAGMSYSLGMMWLFLMHFFLLYVLPLLFVVYSLIEGTYSLLLFWLPLLQYSLMTAIRISMSRYFAMPMLQALLHPVAVLMGMAIGINSVRWAYRKKGTEWKGRNYQR